MSASSTEAATEPGVLLTGILCTWPIVGSRRVRLSGSRISGHCTKSDIRLCHHISPGSRSLAGPGVQASVVWQGHHSPRSSAKFPQGHLELFKAF